MNLEYPPDSRFKCLKCGICCGDTHNKIRHILLLEIEAEKISSATAKSIAKFAEKIEGKEPYTYEMSKILKEDKCVFLKQNQCTIYDLRPLICRFYPFELKTKSQRKPVFSSTSECPGIGKGPVLRGDYFRKLFQLARLRMKEDQRKASFREKT